jgi:hypothetical protein
MVRKLGVANLVLLSIPLACAVGSVPTSSIAQTVFAGPFTSIQVQAEARPHSILTTPVIPGR